MSCRRTSSGECPVGTASAGAWGLVGSGASHAQAACFAQARSLPALRWAARMGVPQPRAAHPTGHAKHVHSTSAHPSLQHPERAPHAQRAPTCTASRVTMATPSTLVEAISTQLAVLPSSSDAPPRTTACTRNRNWHQHAERRRPRPSLLPPPSLARGHSGVSSAVLRLLWARSGGLLAPGSLKFNPGTRKEPRQGLWLRSPPRSPRPPHPPPASAWR